MKRNRSGQAAIFSDSDFNKIRKNLIKPSHRLIFDLLRYTGERIGAVVQLRVDDCYSCRQLQCNPLPKISYRAETRKMSRGKSHLRQVWTHPVLTESLQNYNVESAGSWLFPTDQGHIKTDSFDEVLRRAIKKAKLEHKGFSSHSFRRSLITRLARQGIGIKEMQAITGHRDIRSLMAYVEVDESKLKNAIFDI